MLLLLIFFLSAGNETRACSPDSEMSEVVRDSLSPPPKHATASEMTLSSQPIVGEEVLFHFLFISRVLILFLVFQGLGGTGHR